MPRASKPVSRLHSQNPADARWRAQQAQVDADIEGLARDPRIEQRVAEMRANGLGPRERINALIGHARAAKGRRTARL